MQHRILVRVQSDKLVKAFRVFIYQPRLHRSSSCFNGLDYAGQQKGVPSIVPLPAPSRTSPRKVLRLISLGLMSVIDIISGRYVDRERLSRLLGYRFGEGNFEVDFISDDYTRQLWHLLILWVTCENGFKILRLPVAEKETKHFLPRNQLLSALTPEAIKPALQEEKLEPWQDLSSIAEKVHKSARRTFAILVALRLKATEILRFLEYDRLQTSAIDHRLPYSIEDLKKYVPDFAQEFFEKQWEYCAPVFFKETDHHFLHDNTILPFLENTKISSGGFGKGSKDKEHERELHNLCLLNQLKHPYISELVCFYTYKKRRNFIFRLAEGGDLSDLLAKSIRPKEFETDFSVLAALCRLSSAIEKMHTFILEKDVDLGFVGLHRDLKPKNILVHGNNFILADFGLSHLKSNEESSKTLFSGGGADYLAPECEDPQEGFKKGKIGRASDIWSLGCVFLEVLVYMTFGAPRVAEFRELRKFRFKGCTMYSFYNVGPTANEAVGKMMEVLEPRSTQVIATFLRLIRQMLKIGEKEQPVAHFVTSFLSLLAVCERLYSIDRLYETMVQAITSSQANLEHERFQPWKQVLGLPTPESINQRLDIESTIRLLEQNQHTLDFETTISSLDQMGLELDNIVIIHEGTSHPLFINLQRINDRLWTLLPKALRERAWIHLKHTLLKHGAFHSEDLEMPGEMQDLVSENPVFDCNRLINTIFLRYMVRKADTARADLQAERIAQGKSDLTVNPATIVDYDTVFDNGMSDDDPLLDNSTAELIDGTHIFIEWIKYGHHWEGDIMDEMIRRVGNIAVFLHESAGTSRLPRLLTCRGFFNAPSRDGFGLVFETPATTARQSPLSLSQMIKNSTHSEAAASRLPDLGKRFELALILAESILQLHHATFLHKSISSMNVIFFTKDTSQPSIEKPYLIGFNYVRPNDPKAFTEGPPPGKSRRCYHHPDYSTDHMRQGKRFNLAYDYYSLGLVLLEIGLWQDVVKSSSTKVKSALELKDKLLRRRVPLLGFTTGKTYEDVMTRCLQGSMRHDGDDDATILEQFEVLVVQPLRELKGRRMGALRRMLHNYLTRRATQST
ncbi:hypothetical protein BU23DRAFT_576086 [Bimuria novae-zelandiae CBS 107.79]|uniref:Protein kinase domain-containing protein n=1 Tax=Bimuria novae-zelandiae CBS 107.79 TaxID=1447943 RepID=A0A6A5UGM3_9PLEO|nr:hypothetical protein BU23DRAFT_576086 [Bimuria novae-zelandiae CBS 107.79]